MKKVIKKTRCRKNEILDAAQAIFFAKGYSDTTINDILASVKISKGAFYHYFKSKEEIMDEILSRFIETNAEVVSKIAKDPKLSALEKIRAIGKTNYSDLKQREVLNRIQKMNPDGKYLAGMVSTIEKYTPIFAEILEQGIREGIFKTDYPKECVEYFILMNQFILSGGLLPVSDKEIKVKAKALAHFMDCILHAKPGTFAHIYKKYK